MTEAAVSIVSGLLTLIGVCVTAWFGNRRTAMEVSDFPSLTLSKTSMISQ